MGKLFFINNAEGYYKFFLDHYNIPDNIEIIPHYTHHPKGLLKKITHKLFVRFLPLRNPITNKKIIVLLRYLYPNFPFQKLLSLDKGDSVLMIDITNPNTLMMLRNTIPSCVKFYNHLLNPIKNNAPLLNSQKTIDRLKKKGIILSTFDKSDAQKYDITFREQFYCFVPEKEKECSYNCDFFFCGLAKDRESQILDLTTTLQKMGYSCKIIIPQSHSEYVSCEQYIQLLKRCKCVIDINQNDQVGLSRRPLEALFFNKKLITNNPTISSYDFYNHNNIFCLNIDSIENIPAFMQLPLEPISTKISDQYTIDNWLKQFVEEEC